MKGSMVDRKFNKDIVQKMTGQALPLKDVPKISHSDKYNIYFDAKGNATVPVQRVNIIDGKRKRRFAGFRAERKQDDTIIFEKALQAEPMVFRSVLLIAKYMTSYGFNFGYKRRFNSKFKNSERELLEFLENWADYVGLSQIYFQISACMSIYGDAYLEKIYDDKPMIEGGWGISSLKLLHPRSMYVERDEHGIIIRYWQLPPTGHIRTLEQVKESEGLPLDPRTIVHFKWNDIYNGTYGKSDLKPLIDTISMKVGMREDAALMVQQRASPMIVWLVGDMENPVPADFLAASASYLSTNSQSDVDLVLPGFMKPEVLAPGKDMPDVIPYIQLFSSEIIKGMGVPEVLLGEGNETTEATASVQLESFYGESRFRQNYMGDKTRREIIGDMVFPMDDLNNDLIVVEVKDTKSNVDVLKKRDFVPKQFKRIPTVVFNPIMGQVERVDKALKSYMEGVIDLDEARELLGRRFEVNKKELHPAVREIEANTKLARDQLNQEKKMGDSDTEIRTKDLEIKEKVANKPVPASPAQKPKSNIKNTSFP